MRVREIYLLSFIVTALPVSTAVAQEKFRLPSLQTYNLEFVKKIAAQAKSLGANVSSKNSPSRLRTKALNAKFKDVLPRTRGAQDVLLFRNAAPSVVLLLLENGGICSGALLKDNFILTAAHCVEDEQGDVINPVIQELTGRLAVNEITVIFKPSDPDGKPRQGEVVKAAVYKVDHQRELALLRLLAPPPRSISPLEISSADDVEIGADIHAIGHPHGLNWTYTKGVVSQVRADRSWKYRSSSIQRRATVVQTQAPINGGNSGGPLLLDDGKIVGVAVSSEPGAENINFAIAAKEVRFFLNDFGSVLPTCNELRPISPRQHDDETKAFITPISARCDGEADIFILEPDDQNEPFRAIARSRKNDKTLGEIFGQGRTGRWSESVWDIKFDETYPLLGLHRDGKLFPDLVGPRCPRGSKAAPKLVCSRI